MKRIVLKSLELTNFKGIRDLKIEFDDSMTVIYAENGVGKTTICDAFSWILFGKDSQDRVVGDKESNFQIKTYDKNGDIIHFLEHTVTGVLDVDGKELKLSKTYKEKWTKKRGQAEEELTGHETTYYVNDVPVRMNDYNERIKEIIDENIFKLITNPMYFSMKLSPKDRRDALMAILGDIDDEQVINYNENLAGLRKVLGGDKTIEEFKAMIAARKKKYNADIANIPPRIDECYKTIKEIDFEAIEKKKAGITAEINTLKAQLSDIGLAAESGSKERLELQSKFYAKQAELNTMQNEWTTKLNNAVRESNQERVELESEIKLMKSELDGAVRNRNYNINILADAERLVDKLKKDYVSTRDEVLTMDENSFMCPTCKREYDTDKVEDMRSQSMANFEAEKARKLAKISQEGKANAESKRGLESLLASQNDEIAGMELRIVELNEKLAVASMERPLDVVDTTRELREQMAAELIAMKEQMDSTPKTTSNDEVKKDIMAKLQQQETELKEAEHELTYKEMNKERTARIEELKAEEKKLAQQIADLQRQEILTEEFTRTKVELLEGSINSKFKYVTFKLFNVQVNGAVTDTCEILINGIPFSNANSASQINAGLDVINSLSDFYGVKAAIFIDRAECVNHLIPTDSQLIKLKVSLDKTFRIERGE